MEERSTSLAMDIIKDFTKNPENKEAAKNILQNYFNLHKEDYKDSTKPLVLTNDILSDLDLYEVDTKEFRKNAFNFYMDNNNVEMASYIAEGIKDKKLKKEVLQDYFNSHKEDYRDKSKSSVLTSGGLLFLDSCGINTREYRKDAFKFYINNNEFKKASDIIQGIDDNDFKKEIDSIVKRIDDDFKKAALQRYSDSHREDYKDSTKPLVLNSDNLSDDADFKKAVLQRYFDSHKKDYKDSAKPLVLTNDTLSYLDSEKLDTKRYRKKAFKFHMENDNITEASYIISGIKDEQFKTQVLQDYFESHKEDYRDPNKNGLTGDKLQLLSSNGIDINEYCKEIYELSITENNIESANDMLAFLRNNKKENLAQEIENAYKFKDLIHNDQSNKTEKQPIDFKKNTDDNRRTLTDSSNLIKEAKKVISSSPSPKSVQNRPNSPTK